MFGAVLWNLWLYRNSIVFGNTIGNGGLMLEMSRDLLRVVIRAGKKCGYRPLGQLYISQGACSWSILPSGWVKLNTDGAKRVDNFTYCGCILRDHLGKWLSGFSIFIGVGYFADEELDYSNAFAKLALSMNLEVVRHLSPPLHVEALIHQDLLQVAS
ncbi:hypothetical protein V6N11_082762 [Hibiscus sabdariffa]|uniref:RNase H type-1 domain-containing protein n=1 Tax=Hibiscus sabdariffa TaxID=183260 RepID=A0ABR2QJW9_9ROSI